MIHVEDIKKLAHLARIQISEEEATQFSTEVDAILGYVTKVSESEVADNIHTHKNITREDVVTHEPGSCTKELLATAPETSNNLILVKKVLS